MCGSSDPGRYERSPDLRDLCVPALSLPLHSSTGDLRSCTLLHGLHPRTCSRGRRGVPKNTDVRNSLTSFSPLVQVSFLLAPVFLVVHYYTRNLPFSHFGHVRGRALWVVLRKGNDMQATAVERHFVHKDRDEHDGEGSTLELVERFSGAIDGEQ